jgi:hypothetical protein
MTASLPGDEQVIAWAGDRMLVAASTGDTELRDMATGTSLTTLNLGAMTIGQAAVHGDNIYFNAWSTDGDDAGVWFVTMRSDPFEARAVGP